jgi:hypothetical protein
MWQAIQKIFMIIGAGYGWNVARTAHIRLVVNANTRTVEPSPMVT